MSGGLAVLARGDRDEGDQTCWVVLITPLARPVSRWAATATAIALTGTNAFPSRNNGYP